MLPDKDKTKEQLINELVGSRQRVAELETLETERKQAGEALLESEEKYRSLINNVKLGIFRSTPEPAGRFLEVNPAMEEITGYSVVRDDAGKILYFDGIVEDITERKRAEERLQHLNAVLRAIRNVNQLIAREKDRDRLLESICDSLIETRGYYNAWIALLDESRRLLMTAEAGLGKAFLPMVKRLKRGELTVCGQRALSQSDVVVTEDPFSTCTDCPLANKYSGRGALTVRLEHGGKVYGFLSASIPAALTADEEEQALFQEVTQDLAFALHDIELDEERKQAEEREKKLQQELYLSSRLAAVGELAAGVAHEINNPLTGIMGFSQRLLRKSTDEKVNQDLERIHNEALRAAKVVENLLTFARRHEPQREYYDINDIEQKALDLRAYELKTGNIKVALDLAPSLSTAMVDFRQIQEVFLNIILNAEQAMIEANKGVKLSIKTEEMKGCIRVMFTDDGPGIPAGQLDKVFDPFFTTRGAKGGTGLGLSICHGIVAEHGGKIRARSKPGKGATFVVELPVITEEVDEGK